MRYVYMVQFETFLEKEGKLIDPNDTQVRTRYLSSFMSIYRCEYFGHGPDYCEYRLNQLYESKS